MCPPPGGRGQGAASGRFGESGSNTGNHGGRDAVSDSGPCAWPAAKKELRNVEDIVRVREGRRSSYLVFILLLQKSAMLITDEEGAQCPVCAGIAGSEEKQGKKQESKKARQKAKKAKKAKKAGKPESRKAGKPESRKAGKQEGKEGKCLLPKALSKGVLTAEAHARGAGGRRRRREAERGGDAGGENESVWI
jgi:hypothetical protein